MLFIIANEWIGAIATYVVGGLALIVAIWTLSFLKKQIDLLRKQIQDLRESIEGATYQNIYEQMLNIDRFFIENPELKPYFYSNRSITTEDKIKRDKLFSIAEMLIDFFDNVYYQQNLMETDKFEAFWKYLTTICENSPVLRDHVIDRAEWYPGEFVCELIKSCSSLDKDERCRKLHERCRKLLKHHQALKRPPIT